MRLLTWLAITVMQDHNADFVDAGIFWVLELQLLVYCLFDCCTGACDGFGILGLDLKTNIGNVGLGKELSTKN